MQELLQRLDTILRHLRPDFYQSLQPGMSEREMAEFEKKLGVVLPSDFKAFYYWRNGVKQSMFFIDNYALMSSKQILECHFKRQRLAERSFSSVQNWWQTEWIPFLDNGSRDNICLDLNGSFRGIRGQVIEFLYKDLPRTVYYESFQKWLETTVLTLERNFVANDLGQSIIVNEDYYTLYTNINKGYPKFYTAGKNWKEVSMKVEQQIDLTQYMRPDLLELEEYVPIEPLEKLSERIGIPVERIVKLDANENPYGIAPAALEAVKNQPYYHIYPDPTALFLREALQEYTGIDKERIFIGAGADELIELVMRLFITPGDNIIDLVPTFGMYSFLGKLYGAKVKNVERNLDDYSINLEATLAAIDEHTKLIFVCTPNNPTANPANPSEVKMLLETGRIVVVDEAYHDFQGYSYLPLTQEYPNLIVFRTFSKLSGLAGLRVGYGVFPPEVIRQLWKIKQPYNTTVAGQEAARASLKDRAWLDEHIAKIVSERERLYTLLEPFKNVVEPLPSASNFVFCRIHGRDAKEIKLKLERRGIFIRYFNKPLLQNAFRISIGTPEQMEMLINNLAEILNDKL
jgi:histidinol-phosphate aminotransferase